MRQTVRQAARDFVLISKTETQAMEHALTITERERDEARELLREIAAEARGLVSTWPEDMVRVPKRLIDKAGREAE